MVKPIENLLVWFIKKRIKKNVYKILTTNYGKIPYDEKTPLFSPGVMLALNVYIQEELS